MHQNWAGFKTNIQPHRGTSGGLFVLGMLGLLNRNVYYNSDTKYCNKIESCLQWTLPSWFQKNVRSIYFIDRYIFTKPVGPLQLVNHVVQIAILERKRRSRKRQTKEITVEPRFNEPLYNKVLGITNYFLQPGQNYNRLNGRQPRFNEPRFNGILVLTNTIHIHCRKIYLDITNRPKRTKFMCTVVLISFVCLFLSF